MTRQQMLMSGHCSSRGSSLAAVQCEGAGGGWFCFMYVLQSPFLFTLCVLGVKKWEIWTVLAKHIHTNPGFCLTCSAMIILIYSAILSKWIKQASPFYGEQDHIHDTFFLWEWRAELLVERYNSWSQTDTLVDGHKSMGIFCWFWPSCDIFPSSTSMPMTTSRYINSYSPQCGWWLLIPHSHDQRGLGFMLGEQLGRTCL